MRVWEVTSADEGGALASPFALGPVPSAHASIMTITPIRTVDQRGHFHIRRSCATQTSRAEPSKSDQWRGLDAQRTTRLAGLAGHPSLPRAQGKARPG